MKVIVIVVSEIIVTKNHTERNKKILTETIGDMRYRISPNNINNEGYNKVRAKHYIQQFGVF